MDRFYTLLTSNSSINSACSSLYKSINLSKSPHKQSSTPKNNKKIILDEESTHVVLSYFQCNNFQDFNTWQQIAKTKTQYKFAQNTDKYECQIILKWENTNQLSLQTIISKGISTTSKKNAKKKALLKLVELLIHKGLIGLGFKQANFMSKLPRRKRIDSSEDSQDEKIFQNTIANKTENIFVFIKDKNYDKILDSLNQQNISDVWGFALVQKDIKFMKKVLKKIFFRYEINDIQNEKQILFQPTVKQVSYVEQFKDPFQEDLTDFIRYYLLQRPKYQIMNFNQKNICVENSIIIKTPTQPTGNQFFSSQFKNFITIEQKLEFLRKTKKPKDNKVKERQFFRTEGLILPKFQQDLQKQETFSIKIIEKLYNQILLISDDYQYGLEVVNLLTEAIGNIFFVKQSKKEKSTSSDSDLSFQRKQSDYYKKMKSSLITEFMYNLHQKQLNISKLLSLQGMILEPTIGTPNSISYQFLPKQPEEIVNKKVCLKANENEFRQKYEFCIDEFILVKNKLSNVNHIGIITQLTQQSIKIYLPFLKVSQSTCQQDFPKPATIYKLLNGKIFNKISTALIHSCKYYINYVDPTIDQAQYVTLIYHQPSSDIYRTLIEILSECIARKFFTLVISENYEILYKKLTNQFGFKGLKITSSTDQKQVAKYNLIFASPLNVTADVLSNSAFDRVLIDQANKVPQIISLLCLIKCTKQLYLIGDPHLSQSQMHCPQSSRNKIEQSLFSKLLYSNKQYTSIISTDSAQSIDKPRIFDISIVQWLKNSIYLSDNDIKYEIMVKTPVIKGFNWPSINYRICLINNTTQQANLGLNYKCFLISWILAQVLKSGYIQLAQITCCVLNNSSIPILQQYIIKVLVKMGLQPVQWPIVMNKMLRPLDGSRFNSNDLLIILAEIDQQHEYFEQKLRSRLISGLLQAQRGLIIIGDLSKLTKSKAWANFIDWAASKKLILNFNQQFNHL